MALRRQVSSLSPFLIFLYFHALLHTTSDAADSSILRLQNNNCSTSGNYTATSAYAANVIKFLAALPENAVAKNGGFYNGTIGEGPDAVYGLALCPADYSRADCGDCLTAAAAPDGLPSLCPGSTTVLAMFERCLIRYSNVSFLGTAETGIVLAADGKMVGGTATVIAAFGPKVAQNLNDRTDDAILVPQRFAANSGAPFVLVQCTWDLSPDKCKQCLNALTKNATEITGFHPEEGQRKSYSCSVRYSNTSFMVVPFTAGPGSAPAPPTGMADHPPHPSSSSRNNGPLIIGGAVVLALLVVLGTWSMVSWCMVTRTRESFGSGTRLKPVEYRDLSIATKGFSKENKIGEGGFGVVYKGVLKEKPVAVKRILKDSTGEFKDFLAELGAIDGTGHLNIVRLEGWCCSINNFLFWWLHRQNLKLFLVYELVTNGSLQDHLHKKPDVVLPWTTRYKIVRGIGSALRYLHHDCNPYILHRDIKPANILLDDEFNAKLGDFGLSRVADNNVVTSVQTMAVGTMGYMDPQCMEDGQVKFRPSSDVYSFGIVLLEIAHGKNNPVLVRQLQKDQPAETFVMDAADKKLAGKFDETQMERVLLLGLRCSEQDEGQRPSLVGAMQFLENGGELHPATPDERHDTAHLVNFS